MAWTTPATVTTGDLMTAAFWNTQVRDNMLTLATGGEWTTWSPSYSNITVGDGSVTARYMRIGDLVAAFWQFTMGGTSAYGGAGSESVSVPVTPASHYDNAISVVGHAVFSEGGSTVKMGYVRLNDSLTDFDLVQSQLANTDQIIQGAVTATDPFTFGSTDVIEFTAVYEAA